jgi:hypothetical protein
MDSDLVLKFTTSWVTLPSQCFSHSQGFLPSTTFRPYFMPIPLLGFSLQGRFPPIELSVFSNGLTLLQLVCLSVIYFSFLKNSKLLGLVSVFLSLTLLKQ